jgi:hypothetical protein
VDRFVSRVCKVCKPVTVLSVIVVTTCRLLNKPITNPNGVFSSKTRANLVSEVVTNLDTPQTNYFASSILLLYNGDAAGDGNAAEGNQGWPRTNGDQTGR